MIKVVGVAECIDSTVEVDPWIPLDVTWHPRPEGPLLYLRVSGSGGGEVEFKVDQRTGRLVELVIIDSPPEFKDMMPAVIPGESSCNSPIIDRSLWEWRENADYERLKSSVARIVEPLAFVGGADIATLIICGEEAASYVECRGVRVGISSSRFMTEISTWKLLRNG